MTYLGIDVGTSATKAVILASDGTVVARSRVPHPAARGAGPGRADPSAWRASITAAVRELAPHTATVRGVGMDTHCPTALLLDAAGEPLTAGITWDHPGLAEPTAQLIAALEPAHRRLLGNHLMPATAMGAAHRLLQTIEPEAAAAASTFGLAGTWLGQWLTGERAIDPTQASYTGLMASTDGSCRWLAMSCSGWEFRRSSCRRCGRRSVCSARCWRPRPRLSACRRAFRSWSDPATHPRPPTRWAPSRAAGRCSSWAPRTWCPMHWPSPTRAPRRCNGSTSEPAGG